MSWIPNLFTTINLLGGVVAIAFCIDGLPFEAGLSVMIGYFAGDTLDGWLARKLGTANQFGAEFDTIADHTSHVIAPAAIVYTVYKDVGLVAAPWDKVLAIALASSLVITVSIRHARNIVAPIEYKGVWAGLPRSVLGFWAIGYCNATLAADAPGGWWLGVFLIPAMAIATLTYLPFPSHRMARNHRWYVQVLAVLFLGTTTGILILRPERLFDVVFFWMSGYSLTSWLSLTVAERRTYFETVAAARQSQAQSQA
jgi:phosphatidylserine synthase